MSTNSSTHTFGGETSRVRYEFGFTSELDDTETAPADIMPDAPFTDADIDKAMQAILEHVDVGLPLGVHHVTAVGYDDDNNVPVTCRHVFTFLGYRVTLHLTVWIHSPTPVECGCHEAVKALLNNELIAAASQIIMAIARPAIHASNDLLAQASGIDDLDDTPRAGRIVAVVPFDLGFDGFDAMRVGRSGFPPGFMATVVRPRP